MADTTKSDLPVGFGTVTATFVVVSSMVGVGILTTSGTMVATLESHQLMLMVWAAGGLIALCGALSLAEMAAAWPGAGGEYPILLEAFGPFPAFLGGWATLVVGFAAPIAAASAAMSLYLLSPWNLPPGSTYWARQALATLTILAFTLVHCAGHRHAVRAQGITTALEVVVMVLFVGAGLFAGRGGLGNLVDAPAVASWRLGPLAYSLVFVAYGYTGWNGSAFLAGEVRDPSRTLPRSIVLGTLAVIALYLGINVVYALAIPAHEIVSLAGRDVDLVVPIAEMTAKKLGGDRIAVPTALAISLLLLATVSAYLLTGPRIMFAMARAGQFPAFAGRLSARRGTPAAATVALAAVALVLLWAGSFDQVVVYAGVGLSLTSMMVVASIYVLRAKYPERPRPFRVPGYPVVPAIYLLGSAALVVGVTIENPTATATAIASIAAGWPVYRWFHSSSGRKPPLNQSGTSLSDDQDGA